MNIKIILAYEGTRYLGWQKTAIGLSIEEELEKALFRRNHKRVSLQAASRTDAGVHAKGQVVNFFSDSLPVDLNNYLPEDIKILRMEEAPETFHPTLHATGKEYHYELCLGPAQTPFYRKFSWHFPYPLCFESMLRAASSLKGKHDFSAFTNEKQLDNVREIFDIGFDFFPENRLKIRVSGNNFLYKMVRNIVGTLVYVGCGKLLDKDISSILESRDRTRAGITAPAHGLTLNKVFYE